MRVALAAVLFSQPDLLLLDEPTNYLDLEGALWLESYLAKYPHTVIIISHDRGLLNRAVGSILHLEDRKLTYYAVPYDKFAERRAERLAQAESENAKAKARIAHLQSFVDRFRYKASKAVQAQSRLKMIERIQLVSTPQEAALRAFSFPEPEELSPPIINLEGGVTGYGETEVLRRLNLRIDQDDRIALLGKNGQGKSTLSKLLSDRLPLMAGKMSRSNKLRIGYFAQHQVDELYVDETPLDHLRRLRPDEAPGKWRSRLAGFGLNADQAETEVGRLSGAKSAAVAADRHHRRAAYADPRRADQPSGHRKPRGAGRGADRLFRRGGAGQPRHAPAVAGGGPAVAGLGRDGQAVRRRSGSLSRNAVGARQTGEDQSRRQPSPSAPRARRCWPCAPICANARTGSKS